MRIELFLLIFYVSNVKGMITTFGDKETGNSTPRKILWEEFLIPMEISQYRLSKELKIPQTRISEIIKGNRRISADTAVRSSAYFGNYAKFWIGLQVNYDIENEISKLSKDIERIVTRGENKKVIANWNLNKS